ncbi:MAG: MBL fold metallo-hydrolase [Lentisphaerae bacterium]|jgi:glyoxylase-like metal-dependent hydrolase (beta-lactamase superfamily II)|nr:MBL fold metallo-hydrolase [Lentisphaerota bacterium]
MKMEICPGIHLMKYPCGTAWTGMVLIVRRRVVLIDTAFAPAIDSLLYPYLETLGLKAADIDVIINTHVHGDHIGGNARLQAEAGAELAVHELGAAKLRDPYLHLNRIRSRFSPLVPFQEVPTGLASVIADRVLHDGDRIDLGDSELRIIHTPGHDSDSLCIFEPQSGCLFSGDSLQGQGTLSAGLAFYQDLPAYRHSLQKIAAMSGRINCLIAGHPFSPTDGIMRGEQVTEFLALCRDTTDRYDHELRRLLRSHRDCKDLKYFTDELLASAGLTVKPTVPVLAFHTVAEHLKDIQGTQSL